MMSSGFLVLRRSWRDRRGEIEELRTGTEARDFVTEARDLPEIGVESLDFGCGHKAALQKTGPRKVP